MKVCTVTTLRESVIQTLAFVNYHLNVGIDKVILFLDDPKDPAYAKLENHPNVLCYRCDDDYWNQFDIEDSPPIEVRQDCNTRTALDWAREHDYQWIIHIDSDELIYCNSDIKQELDKFDNTVDSVRFSLLEASPQDLHYKLPFSEVSLFKRQPSRLQRILARALNQNSIYYHDKFLIGHRISKVATRVTPNIGSIGIHHAHRKDESVIDASISKGITLLHFDCCGLDIFRQKWARRVTGSGECERLGKKRSKQLQEFSDAHDDSPEAVENLYKRIYYFAEHEIRYLKLIGMAQELSVPHTLFEQPITLP